MNSPLVNPIHLQSKINRTIFFEGRPYLFFSGTSYLGMGAIPEFEELVKRGTEKYGLNHGLSRINNVRLTIYDQFETIFAGKSEAEKALVYSSGYLAGNAAITYLKKYADRILVAPDTHPAVLPDELVPDPLNSFANWKKECLNLCNELPPQRVLILANAVDALKPAIHNFDWIADLPEKHEYTLLVDDSHAFGVIGNKIFGTYSRWKYLPVNLLVSGSLGKALCLPAGIILGNQKTLKVLEQDRIFRSASPPPPGYLMAFIEGQSIYLEQIEKLRSNIQYFSGLMEVNDHFSGESGFPVLSFKDANLVGELKEKAIIVSSFSYPTENDPTVNRIVLSAHHEEADLFQLWSALKNWPNKI